MLPAAIGAVVDGESWLCQTPDSGQRSPVRAVVPSGLRIARFLSYSPPGHATALTERPRTTRLGGLRKSSVVACPPRIGVAGLITGDPEFLRYLV